MTQAKDQCHELCHWGQLLQRAHIALGITAGGPLSKLWPKQDHKLEYVTSSKDKFRTMQGEHWTQDSKTQVQQYILKQVET